MADDQQNDAVQDEEVKVAEEEAAEETAQAAEDATEASEEVEAAVEETNEEVAATEPEAAPASEPAAEEPKKPVKAVSASLEKIIEQIEKLSVLELADLVHALEDRFGVSAAPVAVAGAAAGPAASGEPAEEKTTFNVVLTAAGANKISVIKAVREIVPTLGLKEAKDLVEAAPKPVLEGANKEASAEAKTKLEAAGGTVELQ